MSLSLNKPDGHVIVLSGTFHTKQSTIKNKFKSLFKGKAQFILPKEIGDSGFTILAVGHGASPNLINQADALRAAKLNGLWVQDVYQLKDWIYPDPKYQWSLEPTEDEDQSDSEDRDAEQDHPVPEKTDKSKAPLLERLMDLKGPAKIASQEKDESTPKGANDSNAVTELERSSESKAGAKGKSSKGATCSLPTPKATPKATPEATPDATPDAEPKPVVKEELVDDIFPPSKGPNGNETDPVRRAWYDQVKGGPWLVTAGVHPADELNGTKTPRTNYTMRIEGVFMHCFIVTDPKTPIFVHLDMVHLRDSFLLPVKQHASLKERYIKAGGHQIPRRTQESLKMHQLKDFCFWSVAYNGNICYILGNFRNNEENESRENEPDVLGVWSRTDFKGRWSSQTDRYINSIREAVGHGSLKACKKAKNTLPDIDAFNDALNERGKPIEIDPTANN